MLTHCILDQMRGQRRYRAKGTLDVKREDSMGMKGEVISPNLGG
jgi:hypothetical protein